MWKIAVLHAFVHTFCLLLATLTSIGDVSWDNDDLIDKLDEFADLYKNKPIYEHSVDKVIKSGLFKHIILVVKNNFFIKRKFVKI